MTPQSSPLSKEFGKQTGEQGKNKEPKVEQPQRKERPVRQQSNFTNHFATSTTAGGRIQELFAHAKEMVTQTGDTSLALLLLPRQRTNLPCSVIVFGYESGNTLNYAAIMLEMDSNLKATYNVGRNGDIPLTIGDTFDANFVDIMKAAIGDSTKAVPVMQSAMVLSRNIEEVLQSKDEASINNAIRQMLAEASKSLARTLGIEAPFIDAPEGNANTYLQVGFERASLMVDGLQHRVPNHGSVTFGHRTKTNLTMYEGFGENLQARAPYLIDLTYVGRNENDRRANHNRCLKPIVAVPPVSLEFDNMLGDTLASLLVYTVATADSVISAGRHREYLVGQGLNGLMRHLPMIMGLESSLLGDLTREEVEKVMLDIIDVDAPMVAMDIGYFGISDDVASMLTDTTPNGIAAIVESLDAMTDGVFSQYYAHPQTGAYDPIVIAATPLLIGDGQYDRDVVELRELNYLNFTSLLAKNNNDLTTYENATGFNDHNIDAKFSHLYGIMSNVMTDVHIYGKGTRVILTPHFVSSIMNAMRDCGIIFANVEDDSNRRFNVRNTNVSLSNMGYGGSMRTSGGGNGRNNMGRRFTLK